MRWLTLILLLVGASCSEEDDVLTAFVKCAEDGSCRQGSTCLVDECVEDGALSLGESCAHENQCGDELTCHNLICKSGCARFYSIDDCIDDTWCKPIPDPDQFIGDCSPSECDPSTTDFCAEGVACVAFADHVGGCLPHCEYGFTSGIYGDECGDSLLTDRACQPLGIDFTLVCMPAGDNDSPGVGAPGCDPVRNPCQPGSTCVEVVCRELCFPDQPDACQVGETCALLGPRADVAYCRAD